VQTHVDRWLSLRRKEIVHFGKPNEAGRMLAFEVRPRGCVGPTPRLTSEHLTRMQTSPTSHFFTVDVEEYFQVQALKAAVSREEWISRPSRLGRSIDVLLSTLARHNVTGTFFVLGWIARHRPEVVLEIANAGHEIASHGFWHERVTSLNRETFRSDVRSSKQALEDLVGVEVVGYRAPSFSIVPGCEWAFDLLLEEGYRYDSSLFPIRRRGYGYPNSPRVPHAIRRPGGLLVEFPLATTEILRYPVPAAGGGYLRQLPLTIIRRAFRDACERCEPATFYIHPWEIDPDQPRLPVSAINRVRHYRGLARALERVDHLLTEFRFRSISSYLSQIESSVADLAKVGAA
jgi:polysaccharide deacetylase family protein (PEP-CTERM system associated)